MMNERMDSRKDKTPRSFIIRSYTKDDDKDIFAINLRSWDGDITTHELLENRHGRFHGRPWNEHIAQAVSAHILEEGVETFVAEQNGRVIGFALAQIECDKPDVGIVSYNAVDPDCRGQGIGTALVKQVISCLKEQGVRILVVWTLEAGKPARKVYEHMGFKELTRFVYYSLDCQVVK